MRVKKMWANMIGMIARKEEGTHNEPVAVIPWDEWEAEIKAAEDKRGEEVLELAEKEIRCPTTFDSEARWKNFIYAYRERFDEQG